MAMGRVSHVEWCVTDLAQSEHFYSELFGWRFAPYGDRYRLHTPPQGAAQGTCVGLLAVDHATPSQGILVHIEVADLDAALAQATALGATLLKAKTAVPGHGHYAHISDPDGNLVGLFQPQTPVG